jgi:glutathione synthase
VVPTIVGKAEISVVYLRTGYGPGDYPTETDWEGRRKLERSRAIKCLTFVTQLAGCKKVQQALAVPGAVERYHSSLLALNFRFLDSEKAEKVRKTFTGLYPLDDTSEGLRARALVLANPECFVVKPQREGGGNNIYRSSIPSSITLQFLHPDGFNQTSSPYQLTC